MTLQSTEPRRDAEERALAALDPAVLAADVSSLVRERSVTGQERGAIERLAALAEARGLAAAVDRHDLGALRGAEGYPGEEAARTELVGARVTLPGAGGARLCLNGHLDVVAPGDARWTHDPFAGVVADGRVHGCGSVDMKAGVVAALHAMAAVRATAGAAPAEVVLQGVASEEDGGLGTFAALEADDRFDAALVTEPTGFDVVVAHGGALTFVGTVRGRSAHAAMRLEGVSALDRYVPIHRALAEHERRVNTDVAHPLMRALPLPYPLLVGRLETGRWSSQVPDALRFEGRLGVRVGEPVGEARAALEAAVAAADDGLRAAGRDRLDGRAVRPGRDPGGRTVRRPRPCGRRRRAGRVAARRRGALRRRHAALHRARDPVRDVRHARARARPRGRRVRRRRRRAADRAGAGARDPALRPGGERCLSPCPT